MKYRPKKVMGATHHQRIM